MSTTAALIELADRPFELLKAVEARARTATTEDRVDAGAEDEWVGLGFRVGDLRLVTARKQVRELMYYPGAHPVPGSQIWLLGVANVRGQLMPVTDLKAFLGGGESVISRSTRVLAVNQPETPAGLLVDEVYGFRRFREQDKDEFDNPSLPQVNNWLSGGFRRSGEAWGIVSLQSLVEDPAFLQAAQ